LGLNPVRSKPPEVTAPPSEGTSNGVKPRSFCNKQKNTMKERPKIIVIGGGTGSFIVLSALKRFNLDLTAIVSMVDDGGSTGALRDELGVLPPGDIRKCLVALSRSSRTMRRLFNFRFRKGSLKGHSFGNLFLTSLEKITGNFKNAVLEASQILAIKGRVLPVTLDNTRLFIRLTNKKVLRGEKHLDSYDFSQDKIESVYLKPQAKINPDAKNALHEADLVIIAPGTLYGSLIPNFLVSGFSKALKESRAKIIYVCNLVNKPHNENFSPYDYVSELEKYIGGKAIDYVLINNRKPPRNIVLKYRKKGEEPIKTYDIKFKGGRLKVIRDDLLSKNFQRDSNYSDLIRHDKEKLAKIIMRIYEKKL